MNYAVKELNKIMARLIKSDLLALLPEYKQAIKAIEESKSISVSPYIIYELVECKRSLEKGLNGDWSGYETQRKRQEKALQEVNGALELLSN